MKLVFFLTWSEECIKVSRYDDDKNPKFAITDTKLYVPVVTLSAQDNAKILPQLKTGYSNRFKETKSA